MFFFLSRSEVCWTYHLLERGIRCTSGRGTHRHIVLNHSLIILATVSCKSGADDF